MNNSSRSIFIRVQAGYFIKFDDQSCQYVWNKTTDPFFVRPACLFGYFFTAYIGLLPIFMAGYSILNELPYAAFSLLFFLAAFKCLVNFAKLGSTIEFMAPFKETEKWL